MLNLQTKVGNDRSATVARNVGYRYTRLIASHEVDDDDVDHNRYELTLADLDRVGVRPDPFAHRSRDPQLSATPYPSAP